MKRQLNIAVITGTRSEFGIWRPVLQAIAQSQKLNLQLVVTGMHLLKSFGDTQKMVAGYNFPIAAKVPMYKPNEPIALSLARGTAELSKAYARLQPDLIMVLGDRLEILAASSAALAMQIPIAHVHGGETAPGQWDEQIRHAVTKMAHLHFCATETSARRLRQLGEHPESIHTVGAPAIDLAASAVTMFSHLPTAERFSLPVVTLHPTSPDETIEYRNTRMLLDALRRHFPRTGPKRYHVVGPNNDPGHQGILRAYHEAETDIDLEMSVPQEIFWAALDGSHLLVGNSSAGIIEAATFGCAVINIGDRQAGRQRSANVIDTPWKKRDLNNAILKATRDRAFLRKVAARKNIYGDGHASARIVRVLESLHSRPLSTIKRFCDR